MTGSLDHVKNLDEVFDEVESQLNSKYQRWGLVAKNTEFGGGLDIVIKQEGDKGAEQKRIQLTRKCGIARQIVAVKRLLNEKLGESRMDCDKNSFNSGQECSVKWKDGNWYRGRFLGYCGLDREECCVLLVDYGNLYVTKVQNVRSAIYGERIPALPPSHPPPLPAPT